MILPIQHCQPLQRKCDEATDILRRIFPSYLSKILKRPFIHTVSEKFF